MTDMVLLTVVSAVMGALLPGDSGGGLRKTFSFLAGLLLLLAFVRPIAASVQNLRAFPQRFTEEILPSEEEMKAEEERALQRVLLLGTQNIEKGVETLLIHQFGFTPDAVRAEVVTDGSGGWMLGRITVCLDVSAVCDDGAVEAFLCDTLKCPCAVIRNGR